MKYESVISICHEAKLPKAGEGTGSWVVDTSFQGLIYYKIENHINIDFSLNKKYDLMNQKQLYVLFYCLYDKL